MESDWRGRDVRNLCVQFVSLITRASIHTFVDGVGNPTLPASPLRQETGLKEAPVYFDSEPSSPEQAVESLVVTSLEIAKVTRVASMSLERPKSTPPCLHECARVSRSRVFVHAEI